MSRAAKTTLAGSIVASGLTVWAVHFMQTQERANMYKGVERDEARQAAKRAAREADLVAQRQREEEFQKLQPTQRFQQQHQQQQSQPQQPQQPSARPVAAYSMAEEAGKWSDVVKSKTNKVLQEGVGVGDREDRAYITGRWGLNGLEIGAFAATPLYLLSALRRGSFTVRRLVRANWTTPLAGGAIGSASGVVYSQSLDPTTAAQKSYGYRHDKANVRRDDLYIIGGVIGALLTPAILRSSGGLFNSLLGGGLGLGGTVGISSDYISQLSNGSAGSKGEAAAGNVISDAKDKAEQVRRDAEEKLGRAAK